MYLTNESLLAATTEPRQESDKVMLLTREALLAVTWRLYGERRGCHRHQCGFCGREFFSQRPEAKYCGASCRQRAYRRRLRLRRGARR